MSWTFKLREGVTFHNGEPFNAQTVADWIPLFQGTDNEYLVGGVDKVEVVDDHTVGFVMKRPDPNLLYNLAHEPVAARVEVCDSGALCTLDYRRMPFTKVRRPVWPLDDAATIAQPAA